MIRNQKKSGFTLVELMVAITILVILAVAGFAIYSQAQIVARDARRKADANTMALALELYRQENHHYPPSGLAPGCNYGPPRNDWCTSANPATPWIPTFTETLPRDPLPDGTNPWYTTPGFAYWSNGNGVVPLDTCPVGKNQYFIIIVHLENKNDPNSVKFKHNKWCNGYDISVPTGPGPTYGFGWVDAYAVTSGM